MPIVAPPVFPVMSTPPSTNDMENFDTRADTFLGELQSIFRPAVVGIGNSAYSNALEAQAQAVVATSYAGIAGSARDQALAAAQSAVNSPATRATSPTTETLSAGQKWFATQTGKGWVGGEAVVVASQTDPVGKRMFGIVNDYNGGTGLLGVVVLAGGFRGSGTNAGWNISVTGSHDGVVLLGAGPGQGVNPVSIGWGAGAEGIVRPILSVDGNHWGGLASDNEVIQAAPPGTRGEFYMNAPPAGWLKSNGAAVSRTTYARLFQRIGTFYGAGDGSTTFNLPNDMGLFARGWDESGAVDPARAFGSVQASANLIHSHGGATAPGGSHTPSGTVNSGGAHTPTGSTANAGAHTNSVPQIRVAGGSGPAASLKSEDAAGVAMPTNTVPDHSHGLVMDAVPPHVHSLSMAAVPDHQHVIYAEGASESRPANRAVMVCIKY